MDQSYITHQRRPALIPPGVHLSPEDERAVRLRTGCIDPSKDTLVLASTWRKEDPDKSAMAESSSKTTKRKASVFENVSEVGDEAQPTHDAINDQT